MTNSKQARLFDMILGIKEIHRRVQEEKLVENLSERELKNPEGAGLDLRLGKVFRLEGKGFLGVEERDTPKSVLVGEYKEGEGNVFILNPGEYVLTETIERFTMPLDVVGIIKPRTTLHRSGIIARMGAIDPGYSGPVHPALFNAGGVPLTFELGARYVNVMFLEVKGGVPGYRGQWQGGRVSTDGKEKQV